MAEAATYTTVQGDTWDSIAYKLWGMEECAANLMQANYKYLDILVFSSGTVLSVPDLPSEDYGWLPGWRADSNDNIDQDSDPYYYDDEDED